MPTETTFKAFHYGIDYRAQGGTWMVFWVTNGEMDIQVGTVVFLSGDNLSYWPGLNSGGFVWKIQ